MGEGRATNDADESGNDRDRRGLHGCGGNYFDLLETILEFFSLEEVRFVLIG